MSRQQTIERPEITSDREAYLEVEDLEKHYEIKEGLLNRTVETVKAVDRVSFSIPKGQTFGLVGESGCGKTTLGQTLLHLRPPTGGTITVEGENFTELRRGKQKRFRRENQIVFQDPTSSLNPKKRVKDIIEDPLEIHGIGTPKERLNRIEEILDTVGLPRDYMYSYPSTLSGGQKQRVAIARAVILNPKFIVLDEPTSALDVSVQARIIDLLKDLQKEFDLTYLFISHDLSLVKNISDWLGVMYLGRMVEVGHADRVFERPRHPYTRALMSSVPTVSERDEAIKPAKITLEGDNPDPRNRPSGCAFRARCGDEFAPCSGAEPEFYEMSENHYARCYLYDEEYDKPGY
jgi:oligopeptide transport system ATP-binding protein